MRNENLKTLSDDNLLIDIRKLAEVERMNLVKFLRHLREFERRRLYSQLKYPSLFEFLVRDLKYSEPAAVRRISAMRLIKEMPEIEMKISSGAISLSSLSMARTAFSKSEKAGRPLPLESKKLMIECLENKPARDVKRLLSELDDRTDARPPLEYEDVANELLRCRLQELRGRFAHICPQISLEELMMRICDGLMGPYDRGQNAPSTSTVDNFGVADQKNSIPAMSEAAAKREVWRRDDSCCSNCKSTYAVQIDHIIPRAAGGQSTIENMRLLCRSCNQRAAINYFGLQKMGPYLERNKNRDNKIEQKNDRDKESLQQLQ